MKRSVSPSSLQSRFPREDRARSFRPPASRVASKSQGGLAVAPLGEKPRHQFRIKAGLRTIGIRCGVTLFLLLCATTSSQAQAQTVSPSYADTIVDVQPKMVKIFGSGGLRGLESYQSGFLISPEGHVLTAWSYVLDSGSATVILNDGRKFDSEILNADPRTEIAILKIEADELPHFALKDAVELKPGSRVLAFSNLYGVATGDEPTSVLHGIVSGVTKLAARRGSFETPYRGDVYILDAMTNNAGAAGGVLTDSSGRIAAVLGKELRDSQSNIWLNYAVPISALRGSIEAILLGKEIDDQDDQSLPTEYVTLDELGIVLIPNILRNTPPFVDMVLPNSRAANTTLQSDDLVVLVNGKTASSQSSVEEHLREIDIVDPVRLTVMRDNELIEIEFEPK